MYPIPVLVDNIQLLGSKVNQNSNRNYWKLTRRFFLIDKVSGKSSSNAQPSIIQYAEQLELNIRLREDGLIYPPLLKVKYKVLELHLKLFWWSRSFSFIRPGSFLVFSLNYFNSSWLGI